MPTGIKERFLDKKLFIIIVMVVFSSAFFPDISISPQCPAGLLLAFAEDNVFTDNVGIGTAAPAALTHLSSTAASDLFKIEDNGTGDGSPLVVDENGNLGIGTASTGTYKLWVNGDTYLGGLAVTNGAFTFGGDLEMNGYAIESSTGGLTFDPDDDGTNEVVMDTNGNVGIGTTTPTQKLHVEGQCVTGDTLLPILRKFEARSWKPEGNVLPSSFELLTSSSQGRRDKIEARCPGFDIRTNDSDPGSQESGLSNTSGTTEVIKDEQRNYRDAQWFNRVNKIESSFELPASNFQLIYIPITDVKPGDYVLSLNEETGRIEPHRINGLLDMGTKPVFELITESGKRIETTGNHPYLVKERGVPDGEREQISIRRVEGLAREHEIHGTDLSEDTEFSEPRAIWLDTSANRQTEADAAHRSLLIDDRGEGEQKEKEGLVTEEGKKGTHDSPELTKDKDKCPTDNACFNLSQPFFKSFFHGFNRPGFSAFFRNSNGEKDLADGEVYDGADSGQLTRLRPGKLHISKEREILSRPYFQSSFSDSGQITNPSIKASEIVHKIPNLVPTVNVWKNPLTQPATTVSLNTSNSVFDTMSLRRLWNMAINFLSSYYRKVTYHTGVQLSRFFSSSEPEAYAQIPVMPFPAVDTTTAQWLKVIYLQEGDEIAVLNKLEARSSKLEGRESGLRPYLVNPVRKLTRGIKPCVSKIWDNPVASHRVFSNGINGGVTEKDRRATALKRMEYLKEKLTYEDLSEEREFAQPKYLWPDLVPDLSLQGGNTFVDINSQMKFFPQVPHIVLDSANLFVKVFNFLIQPLDFRTQFCPQTINLSLNCAQFGSNYILQGFLNTFINVGRHFNNLLYYYKDTLSRVFCQGENTNLRLLQNPCFVIPAKAGIQVVRRDWMPASAGMRPSKGFFNGLNLAFASIPDFKDKAMANWLKVIYLQEGDEIAVLNKLEAGSSKLEGRRDKLEARSSKEEGNILPSSSQVGWDKIVSIKYVGYKQVYDIEVEGTHNFVAGHWIENKLEAQSSKLEGRGDKLEVRSSKLEGNSLPSSFQLLSSSSYFFGGIIAHNTYLNGNVGIGTTSPTAKLWVKGSGTTTGKAVSITDSADSEKVTVLDNGSVGIGTGSPGTGTTGQGGATFGSPVLEIAGTGRPILTLRSNNVNNYATIVLSPNNSTTRDTHMNAYADGTFQIYQYSSSTYPFHISPTGNVGIGSTVPLAKLDVAGAISAAGTITGTGITPGGNVTMGDDAWIGLGASAGRIVFDDAGTDGVNIMNGNVGIGSTAPVQKLHVEGQCVTGDSILRRRKRKRHPDGTETDEWEDARIDQIEAGDEILTLDEVTGKLVVRRVNALMDMGVKPIYKITTESGKTIRTTGNHPYLAAPCRYVPDTNFMFDLFFSALSKTARRFYFDILVKQEIKVPAFDSETVNISRAGWQHIVHDKERSRLNLISRLLALPKVASVLGSEGVEPRYHKRGDEEFWVFSAIVDSVLVKVVVRAINGGSKHFYSVVWQGERREIKEAEKQARVREKEKGAVSRLYPRCRGMVTPQLQSEYTTFIQSLSSVFNPAFADGSWTKVAELKAGDLIAVADDLEKQAKWERLTEIELLPAEQVYDIEVEGTHNFIANGIVAHNTYINGNVGIGSTAPVQKLHVEGQCVTGDTLVAVLRKLEARSSKVEGRGFLDKLEAGSSRLEGNILPSSFQLLTSSSQVGRDKLEARCPGFDIRTNDSDPGSQESGLSNTSGTTEVIKDEQRNYSDAQWFNRVNKIESSFELPASSFQLIYIPITEVKPGDYVLSLNEETGRIEPHRINGLLDMGTKPVFELITESGKRIETTGNHPYLVKERGVPDGEREQISIRRVEGLAREHEIHGTDLSEDTEFSEPRAIWLDTSANKQTKTDAAHRSSLIGHREEDKIWQQNEEKLLAEESEENCSKGSHLANPKDKHPLNKVSSDFFNFCIELGNPFFKPFFSNFQNNLLSPFFYSIEYFHKGVSPFISKSFPQNSGYRNYSHNFLLVHLKDTIESLVCQVRNNSIAYAFTALPVEGSWLKAIYLTEGDEIAVVNKLEAQSLKLEAQSLKLEARSSKLKAQSSKLEGNPLPSSFQLLTSSSQVGWDRIVSIKYVGYKQVYDIEVEGTHNFVAGHWIENKLEAQSSKLEGRGDKLEVRSSKLEGNSLPSSFQLLSSSSYFFGGIIAHNTYMNGNLGIGSTGPLAKLDVSGDLKVSGTITGGAGTLVDVTGTPGANYHAKWSDSNTVAASSSVYEDSNGNLGIGTTSPTAKLWVKGSGTTTGKAVSITDSADSEKVTVLDNGNVGIGATGPSAKLELWNSYSSGVDSLRFGYNDTNAYWMGIQPYVVASGNVGYKFRTNNMTTTVDAMAITGAGNVGIGTMSPGRLLHVAGTGFQYIKLQGGASCDICDEFTDGSNYVYSGLLGTSGGTGRWGVYNSGTRMVIQSDGNVGIGTTAPASKLHVNDTTAITTFTGNQVQGLTLTGGTYIGNQYSLIGFRASDFASTGNLAQIGTKFTNSGSYLQFGTSNAYVTGITNTAMTIDYSGNVGIGETAPGAKLSVSGGLAVGSSYDTTGVSDGQVIISGNVGIGTTGPGRRLHVVDTVNDVQAKFGDGSRDVGIEMQSGGGMAEVLRLWNSGGVSNLVVGSSGIGGDIRLTTSAGEKVRIQNNGNVGIGTTTPYSKLQLTGGSAFITGDSGGLAAGAGAGLVLKYSTSGPEIFGYDYGTPTTKNLILQSPGGNVGIGSTGPLAKLDVAGAISATGTITGAGLTAGGNITMGDDAWIGLGASAGRIVFDDAGTDGVNIMNGNLGIGTMEPYDKLEIVSGGDIALRGTGILQAAENDSYRLGFNSGTYTNLHTGSYLTLSTDGAGEAVRITSTGNVGIGETAPGAKLSVSGGLAVGSSYDTTGVSDGQVIISGNVGIGTISPTAKLWVKGSGTTTGKAVSITDSADSEKVTVLDNGNVGIGTVAPTAVTHILSTATSDLFKIEDGGAGDTTPLIVDQNGNLGIGTVSTGTYKLYVGGNTYLGGLVVSNGAFEITGDLEMNGYAIESSTGGLKFDPDDDGTNEVVMDTNGNVGIGTTVPTAFLQIDKTNDDPHIYIHQSGAGNYYAALRMDGDDVETNFGNYDDDYATVTEYAGKSVWQANYGDMAIAAVAAGSGIGFYTGGRTVADKHMVIDSTGNVGIGTTGPGGTLDIAASYQVYSGGHSIFTNTNPAFTTAAGQVPNTVFNNFNNYTGILVRKTSTGVGDYLAVEDSSNNGILYVKSSGNVGIGSTAPLAKLDVSGDVKVSGNITGTMAAAGGWTDSGTNVYTTTSTDTVGIGTTAPAVLLDVVGGHGRIKNASNAIFYLDSGASNISYLRFLNSGDNVADIRVNNATSKIQFAAVGGTPGFTYDIASGNVGIGETAPGAKLSVSGGLAVGSSYDTTGVSDGQVIISGNVGIGTTGPGGVLEVYGGANSVETGVVKINGVTGGVGVGKYIDFVGQAGIGWVNNASSVAGLWMGGSPASKTLYVGTSGTYNGNVGIGSTGPLAKLDVNGTVAATKFTDGGSGYDFFMPNPACPDEEMLRHWAIETDGLKTIYSGNAQTDDTAECIVQMPSWFVPLNDISTCTYSLTSLSGLGQVAVKEKMSPAGAFVVVSQYPYQEFSWTVIVYRGDPIGVRTMRENPIVEKRQRD